MRNTYKIFVGKPQGLPGDLHLNESLFGLGGGAQQPTLGQGLFIHEVPRSHTTTHHSRKDSSGRVISSPQRHLNESVILKLLYGGQIWTGLKDGLY